jgi:cytochrome c oxidase cbb3-type subunit 2
MKHESIETNAGLLIILTLLVISIGGLVEIIPLYYIDSTVETVKVNGKDSVHPYSPLELRGRDIYQREGCYLCHSQMIRPFRDEACTAFKSTTFSCERVNHAKLPMVNAAITIQGY